jgi:DNA polymerase III delta prime subunit
MEDQSENLSGLPKRVKTIFNLMIKEPSLRKHIILTGPPGSGKTSSAKLFVEELYGKDSLYGKFSRALFLNSSDERGLEAVRSRVYPFIRSSLHVLFDNDVGNKPKIIIFDEAETLTDQAQMALRPLLDEDPNKIMIIFLCNSISRIHHSIVHKFLVLQLESPHPIDFKNRYTKILNTKANTISNIDILFRRGDIRFFLLNPEKKEEVKKIWKLLMNAKRSDLQEIFNQLLKTWMFHEVAMFLFFVSHLLNLITLENTKELIQYTDSDFLKICPHITKETILSSWFEKNIMNALDLEII